MAKLQIEFQVTKSGIPLEISDHLSSLLSSKSDQIPPAYMCNHEKLVFILFDKLDKKLREYLGEMCTENRQMYLLHISLQDHGQHTFLLLAQYLQALLHIQKKA